MVKGERGKKERGLERVIECVREKVREEVCVRKSNRNNVSERW